MINKNRQVKAKVKLHTESASSYSLCALEAGCDDTVAKLFALAADSEALAFLRCAALMASTTVLPCFLSWDNGSGSQM